MGKVYVPVNEFVSYAYGGDVELRGFIVCASQLVVWASYIDAPTVDVWDIVDHDGELSVHIVTDCECVDYCSCERRDYDGPSILSDPKIVHEGVPTANDYLNIALVYS